MFQLAVLPRVPPSRLHRGLRNRAAALSRCKFVATRDKRVQHDWFKIRVEIVVEKKKTRKRGSERKKEAWPANRDETRFSFEVGTRAANLRGRRCEQVETRMQNEKKKIRTRKLSFSIVIRDRSMCKRLAASRACESLRGCWSKRFYQPGTQFFSSQTLRADCHGITNVLHSDNMYKNESESSLSIGNEKMRRNFKVVISSCWVYVDVYVKNVH